MQRIQNKGLKLVYKKDRRFNTKILHKEARLASWETRTLAQSCCPMFKYKFNPEFMSIGKPGTRLHSGPIFCIDHPATKRFINTTAYKFMWEWNNLPAHKSHR